METQRFRHFRYRELTQRNKANSGIVWLLSEILGDPPNLLQDDQIAEDIMENLRAASRQVIRSCP